MRLETTTTSSPTQLELIRAAIRVFSSRRFEDVDLREITAAAGFKQGDLPSHYGGKEGLYTAALWIACRQVGHLAEFLPKPPGIRDRCAPRKAAGALRAHIRMLLSLGLGRTPDALPEPFQNLEGAILQLVVRELSAPRAGLEAHLQEAIGPYAEHLAQCVRALRPDLDGEAVFRMCLSIHGQVLFLNFNPAMVPLLRDQPYQGAEFESLTEHFVEFCLKGIAA